MLGRVGRGTTARGPAMMLFLMTREAQRRGHQRLDGGTGDLAVALGHVPVAGRELGALDVDGQLQPRTGDELPDVGVAAHAAGSAPSTWTGPVSGWMRPRSRVMLPSAVSVRAWSPMSSASRHSSWISSPGRTNDGRLEITVPAVVHDPAESVEHPLAAGGDDGVRRARADDLDGPESVGLRKRGEGFGRIDAYPGLDVQHVAGGSGMRETHAGLLGDGAHDGPAQAGSRP